MNSESPDRSSVEPVPLRYAAGDVSASGHQFRLSRAGWMALVGGVPAAILVVAMVMPRSLCGCGDGNTNVDITKALVAPGGTLATQIELYRTNMGHYPESLVQLTLLPTDPGERQRFGTQPYILDPNSLMDAWGNTLAYKCPGRRHGQSYDLWSNGPDGQPGGDDDIGNWDAK